MSNISYLWKHRARYPLGSYAFFKSWGKRFFLIPDLIRKSYRRRKLINKGALISESAEIGEAIIGGNKKNIEIGSFTTLGRVVISLHDKVKIGKYVCVNDGVNILSASHDVKDPLWQHIKGPIIIEDYVWIATNAIILPGVTIGMGAVIGAGAVISKSVSPFSIVVGNPMVVLPKKRAENLNYNPCEFLALNNAWLLG